MKHKGSLLLLVLLFVQCNFKKADEPVRVGIAWRSVADSTSYSIVARAIEEAGGVPDYMDYESALAYFRVLVQEARATRDSRRK